MQYCIHLPEKFPDLRFFFQNNAYNFFFLKGDINFHQIEIEENENCNLFENYVFCKFILKT